MTLHDLADIAAVVTVLLLVHEWGFYRGVHAAGKALIEAIHNTDND